MQIQVQVMRDFKSPYDVDNGRSCARIGHGMTGFTWLRVELMSGSDCLAQAKQVSNRLERRAHLLGH